MIKVYESIMSTFNSNIDILLDILRRDSVVNSIVNLFKENIRAANRIIPLGINLFMNSKVCSEVSDAIVVNGKEISPYYNIIIEIHNKYYDLTSKKYDIEKEEVTLSNPSNSDDFSDYDYELAYQVRDIINNFCNNTNLEGDEVNV